MAIISAASILLYRDINGAGGGGKGAVIGTLRFKRNVAQRKFDSQVVWEDMENEIPLYNRDSIRTADLSEAEIALNDGTKISLDANSMIILNISQGEANIEFKNGSISASSTGGGAGVSISSGNNTVRIADSDVKLSGDRGQSTNIEVRRGQASVSANGQEQRISQDQRAVFGTNGVNVQRLLLKPISPADNSRTFSQETRQQVNFSWEQSKEMENVIFEISKDRSFGSAVSSRTVTGRETMFPLDEGIFYWRISARNPATGEKETSPAYRLSVVHNMPVVLSSPADSARIESVSNSPMVNFSWAQNEYASSYRISIAQDLAFTKGLRETNSLSTNLGMEIAPGTYFWKVATVSGAPGAAVTSPVRSFSIIKREKAAPPSPVQPESEKKIGKVFMDRQGVTFNWRSNREIVSARLWISTDAAFSRNIIEEEIFTNYIKIKKDLPQGHYFWRLQGKDSLGNLTDYSEPASFWIVSEGRLKSYLPKDDEEIDAFSYRTTGVQFSWEIPDLGGKFRLIVAQNEGLTQSMSLETSSNQMSLNTLPAGQHFWKVQLLGDGGEVVTESETLRFTISDKLRTPAARFPLENAVVDMSFRNALTFAWDRTPGAERYRFSLYQMIGNNRNLIASAVTGDPEYHFVDLTKLDTGRFLWTLTAYGGGRESREAAFNFNITLSNQPETPEIVSPETQFVK